MKHGILALSVLAVALAGCTTPAATDEAGPTTNAPGAAPPGGGASAPAGEDLAPLAAPGEPVVLFLHGDRSLRPEPAAERATVPLDTPVNGPETPGYPVWSGALPMAINLTGAQVDLVFYVTSSSASVRANHLPVFGDLPAFFVEVRVGAARYEVTADGPPLVTATGVAEVQVPLPAGRFGPIDAGEEVRFTATPIYTHVVGAAEFQYVMGPDQPAGLTITPLSG